MNEGDASLATTGLITVSEPLTAEELREFARDPQSHAVDGEQTVSRPAADILALEAAAAAKDSVNKKRRGIVYSKLLPPGPVSDQGGSLSGA